MNRLLLLLVLTAPALSARAGSAFPGGVLDPAGRTAFVPVEDGVEAVDLETGIARWKSRHAAWPLFVEGDRLVGLAFARGALTAVRLDLAKNGERVSQSGRVEVPAWVDASSLRATWSSDGRALTLHWHARGTLGRSASGKATIDLSDPKVTTEKDAPAATAPLPRLLEKRAVRWHRSVAGQLLAVVEEDVPTSSMLRRQKKLVLRVWNEATGKELRAEELIRSARPMLLAGADGLHVWVRDGGTFEAPGDGAAPAPWQVHSALDGHRVARVPFVPGTTKAAVIGTRAYGVAAHAGRALIEGKAARRHELYAVDLESGKVLWRKAVKETGAQPR